MKPVFTHLELGYEEFDESIATADGHTIATGVPEGPFVIDTLNAGDACLQVFREGGANIYQGEVPAGLISIFVGLPAPTEITALGSSVGVGRLAVFRPGEWIVTHSSGVCRYAGLTLPVDRFIEAIESFDPRQTDRLLAGIEPHDISKTQWQTIVDLLTRVLALRSENEALESAPAQQALVADLISAFVAGAADSSERSKAPGRPRKSRSRIRARVSEYLQSVGGAACSVAQMAKYAGISERALRDIVAHQYGMTPKQLIMLRQLDGIHLDLQRAAPDRRVSSIAARHGVWDWNRLAHRYRAVYGQLPSETLAESGAIADRADTRAIATP